MPPFPFPKELFPPGTFPPGMKFSTDFHMPPAVEELLESGGPDALAAMMAGADAPAGTSSFAFGRSDDDEWEDAGDAGGGHRGGSRSARSRRSSRRAGAGPGSGSGSSRRRRGGRGGFPGRKAPAARQRRKAQTRAGMVVALRLGAAESCSQSVSELARLGTAVLLSCLVSVRLR